MKLTPKVHRIDTLAIEVMVLINVLFLLFMFFVMGSSVVYQPGIQVDLPKTSGVSVRGVAKTGVTVALRHDSASGQTTTEIFVNDTPVGDDMVELERQLRRMKLQYRLFGMVVLLNADRSVSYQKIAEVMACIRSLGLSIYLATEEPPRGRPRTGLPEEEGSE